MIKSHQQKIYNKLNEITNQENIQLEILSFEELNKDEKDRNEYALGKYIYYVYNKEYVDNYNKCKNDWLKNRYKFLNNDELKEKVYEIDEFYKKDITYNTKSSTKKKIQLVDYKDTIDMDSFLFTWMHELGHHFNGSGEKNANRYRYEFFVKYMPYYYLFLYKIRIEVFSEVDYKLNYWKVLTSFFKEKIIVPKNVSVILEDENGGHSHNNIYDFSVIDSYDVPCFNDIKRKILRGENGKN